MADAIFRRFIEINNMQEKIFSQSAGLSAATGEPASEYAIKVIDEAGGDLTKHRARKICPDDIDMWDLYFPMTKTHGYILEKAGVPVNKIYIPNDIPDPYGQGLEEYRICRERLEKEVRLFYNNMVQKILMFEKD